MASAVTPHMVTVLHNYRKFWRWALASSFGLPQNGLVCTMFMRLDFSSKFTSPTSTLGPVATLAAEGTEKSWRVFSAMSLVIDGVWESWLTCRLRDRWRDDARSDPSHCDTSGVSTLKYNHCTTFLNLKERCEQLIQRGEVK